MSRRLSQEEVKKYANAMIAFQEEGDDNQLMTLWKIWDRDGSGFIDRTEIRIVMTSIMMQTVDECHIDRMLNKADVNGDGAISYEEFVNMLHDGRDKKLT